MFILAAAAAAAAAAASAVGLEQEASAFILDFAST